MTRANSTWTAERVNQQIEATRIHLHEKFGADLGEAKVTYLVTEISRLGNDNRSEAEVERLVNIIAALVWNGHVGILTDKQVRDLDEMANAILRVAGISSTSKSLAFLYGHVRKTIAQHQRLHGRHWEAAWNSILASNCHHSTIELAQHDRLVCANRFARLGYTNDAVRTLQTLIHDVPPTQIQWRARLELARTLRISQQLPAARAEILKALNAQDAPKEFKTEFAWEQHCCNAQETGNVMPIVETVRHGQPHHMESYVTESVIWAYASNSKAAVKNAYRLRSVARNSELRPQKLGIFFDLACAISDAYDKEAPVSTRIDQLGRALPQLSNLLTLDREMLALVACAKALIAMKAPDLAHLCLRRYQSISMICSNGKTNDSLNLADALLREENINVAS